MTTNKKNPEQTAAEAAQETVNAAEAVADAVQPAPPAKEKIFIPRGSANDDPNFFVSVNGVNYLLPRGKESEVPAHIAAEIRRAWKAQETLDEHKDELLNAAQH